MSKATLEAPPNGGADPGSVVVTKVPIAPGLTTTLYTWTFSTVVAANQSAFGPGPSETTVAPPTTAFVVVSAEPVRHLFLSTIVFATAGAGEATHWIVDMLKTGAKAPGATPAIKP